MLSPGDGVESDDAVLSSVFAADRCCEANCDWGVEPDPSLDFWPLCCELLLAVWLAAFEDGCWAATSLCFAAAELAGGLEAVVLAIADASFFADWFGSAAPFSGESDCLPVEAVRASGEPAVGVCDFAA